MSCFVMDSFNPEANPSGFAPKSRSPLKSRFHWSFQILLFSCVWATVLGDSMSAPETEVSNIMDDADVNACDLNGPPMYCHCNPMELSEVEEIKCQAWGSPTEESDPWVALGQLKNTTFFELSSRPQGALQYFPPSQLFLDLEKLMTVTMKLSAFHQLPSFAFANSSSISEIVLIDNKITGLSLHCFANHQNLSKINLGENGVTEINRGVFANLPKLRQLYLDKNQILLIHDFAFKELVNVEELDLQKNKLTVIAREVFSGLGKVFRLELQENMIEFLGDHVFADMPLIKELDLNGNQIRSVSPTAFYGLENLGHLNMKSNKIVKLKPPTFVHLQQIYFMDLRDNELDTLSESLIEPIYSNLKNISMQLMIEGNRLMCDCRILWIQKLYKETESDHVKRHLKTTQCDLFHTPEQKMRELNPNLAVSYSSNVAVVAAPPEETTTYAFDSIKNVIDLNPSDFKCHDHHHLQQQQEVEQKHHAEENHHSEENNHLDAGYPASQDDSQASYSDDEENDRKSKVEDEKRKEHHHQSHTDSSHQSEDKSIRAGHSSSERSNGSSGGSSVAMNYSRYLTSWTSALFSTGALYFLTRLHSC